MHRLMLILLPLLTVGLVLAAPVPKDEVKLKPATEKEREEVQHNLKEIVLAMFAYHDVNDNCFPGDIVDAKTGKLLLSWRVQLLPYLEEMQLYLAFKLNEPWDSKDNIKLLDKMPKIFAPTRVKAAKGETYYRGFAGKGEFAGLFEPGKKVGVGTITDGTSNTIAVIDAGEAVPWTKPGTDLPVDPKGKLPKLGGMIDGDFYCAMADGTCKQIKRDFDEKTIRAAISRSGEDVYNPESVFVEK